MTEMHVADPPAQTRLLREAGQLFKLNMEDFDGHEWLIAADWIEGQGNEALAEELRASISAYPNCVNPCKCRSGGERTCMPAGGSGWMCMHCHRGTPIVTSWVNRVIIWNLMNPFKEPVKAQA